MIKLSKTDKPAVLEENAETWTKAILDKINAGQKPTPTEKSRHQHPDIKAALIRETHGKCAYCESKLQHIAYGDIEHIIPKSTSPELSFEWSNLTLACDICNTNKGDKFQGGIGLINPYIVDPESRFMIDGPLIFSKLGDNDARLTEESLQLNRAGLVERRQEKLGQLRELLETWFACASEPLKNELRENLKAKTASDQEFSAVASAFLKDRLAPET